MVTNAAVGGLFGRGLGVAGGARKSFIEELVVAFGGRGARFWLRRLLAFRGAGGIDQLGTLLRGIGREMLDTLAALRGLAALGAATVDIVEGDFGLDLIFRGYVSRFFLRVQRRCRFVVWFARNVWVFDGVAHQGFGMFGVVRFGGGGSRFCRICRVGFLAGLVVLCGASRLVVCRFDGVRHGFLGFYAICCGWFFGDHAVNQCAAVDIVAFAI